MPLFITPCVVSHNIQLTLLKTHIQRITESEYMTVGMIRRRVLNLGPKLAAQLYRGEGGAVITGDHVGMRCSPFARFSNLATLALSGSNIRSRPNSNTLRDKAEERIQIRALSPWRPPLNAEFGSLDKIVQTTYRMNHFVMSTAVRISTSFALSIQCNNLVFLHIEVGVTRTIRPKRTEAVAFGFPE